MSALSITNLGRYQIDTEVGRGAMGIVYRAHDPLLERTVAVKTVKIDLPPTQLQAFEQRFFQEAKSAGRLNHPNIVIVYDVGKADDTPYMAMEYLQGEELRHMLDRFEPLAQEKIADIAAQVAEALAYAHDAGVVHRDIKPSNIMIIGGKRVKITDFGIAEPVSGKATDTGALLGSPKYMSPEQVKGLTLDGRSDVFSLGTVLYEMLTGVCPFEAENITAIIYRILHDNPVPAQELNPRVSPYLDRIAGKALSKDPEKRYQNAKEMARDLRRAGAKIKAALKAAGVAPPPPVSAPKRTEVGAETIRISPADLPRENTSSRRFRTLIALSLTVATAIGGLMWFRWDTQQQAAPLAIAVAIPVVPTITPAPLSPPPQTPPAATEEAPTPPTGVQKSPQTQKQPRPKSTLKHKVQTPEALTVGEGELKLAVTPWGEIYVDGKLRGISPPLRSLKLDTGRHKIEIRNTNQTPYQEFVVIEANAEVRIKHKF